MTVIEERLSALDGVVLKHGTHKDFAEGVCAMEAVAWLAGEPHSDAPACVSWVLARFLRTWNDALDDEGRQMLKPFLPRVIGTAGDGQDEARGWLAADWLIRVYTSAWLDVAGVKESAVALRALPPLTDVAGIEASRPVVEDGRRQVAAAWGAAGDAAGGAAWGAAWAAAWGAAGDAAGDAAWAAAWGAAGDAAWAAAGDAAGDAAGGAAWGAAWAAAWGAARGALEPTKVALQASARDLLDRMIEVGR